MVSMKLNEYPYLKLVHDIWFLRKKSGRIKTSYKQDHINLNADVDFDFAGPTVHGAGVLG